ncbi:hypothetical protein [Bacillus thuringiensis]|uniref:hypothetical protein n=1 Tax=Bacillus thuringiensis TaxID=1428 RepID=UPI0021D6774E|nr:hypothetical protein [Bacillus thuringiensis]MCU7667757.1 hypothetical protein [Bacillus thuringiensis]
MDELEKQIRYMMSDIPYIANGGIRNEGTFINGDFHHSTIFKRGELIIELGLYLQDVYIGYDKVELNPEDEQDSVLIDFAFIPLTGELKFANPGVRYEHSLCPAMWGEGGRITSSSPNAFIDDKVGSLFLVQYKNDFLNGIKQDLGSKEIENLKKAIDLIIPNLEKEL